MKDKTLLKVENLKTHFFTDRGVVKAVDGVDFTLKEGETIGIVGESGCGKSVTAMSIMKLVDEPGEIVDGSIMFDEKDVVLLSDKELRKIRGNDISMIFQEPMTSLNPVFRVGDQIIEVLQLHQDMNEEEARKRAIELFELVHIPRPSEVIDDYPHQLSGGMRQRVMIAMALACNPKLLIADEPTTALDVTIQAQILKLMNELKEKLDTAIMLITHDLGVVAQMSDHIIVMYAGKVVEDAPAEELFDNPSHPYTVGLLKSIPKLDSENEKLDTIEGSVPSPFDLPKGCNYYPRCPKRMEKCEVNKPDLYKINDTHKVRCYLYEEVEK